MPRVAFLIGGRYTDYGDVTPCPTVTVVGRGGTYRQERCLVPLHRVLSGLEASLLLLGGASENVCLRIFGSQDDVLFLVRIKVISVKTRFDSH